MAKQRKQGGGRQEKSPPAERPPSPPGDDSSPPDAPRTYSPRFASRTSADVFGIDAEIGTDTPGNPTLALGGSAVERSHAGRGSQ